jgi:hypothetical protein
MKNTKKSKLLLAFLLCLILVFCDLCSTIKLGNVIMIEGPDMEDVGDGFSFSGRVQNIGEGKAIRVRVFIFMFDSEENQLAGESTVVDEVDLSPGENSTWELTISDPDNTIRDQMDPGATTYELSWDDEE